MRLSQVMDVGLRPGQPEVSLIEEIYRVRVGQFRRVANAVLGDPEAAQDAVQDGFVRAIRDRASFRGDAPLESWIWGCVMNAVRTSARRPKRAYEPSSSGHPAQPGPGFDADEDLRRLIRELPERQRLTLFLRYFADLDYDNIAAILGVAPGTVAASLHSAHGSIREALEEAAR